MSIDHIHEHRTGGLKQQNKPHKHGKHRSKGSLEKLNKGRVNILKLQRRRKQELSREERRNQVSQLRQKKRLEYLQKRRGINDAPLLVAVVPLHASIKANQIIQRLVEADPEAKYEATPEGHTQLNVVRLKERLTLGSVSGENLFDTLDLLKVAESVLFLVSSVGLDENGEVTLSAALAQGLPSSIILCPDIDQVPPKRRQEKKIELSRALGRWFSDEKVFGFEKNGDGLMILRKLINQKRRQVLMRDRRPHLLAEQAEFIETSVGKGTLKLTGYVRGQTLDVNSVVHIPGWGDFSMSKISTPGEETALLRADPALQESLESENVPDPMDGEQTWPTEEELKEAEKPKKAKRIPHGMSDYEAAWIPDEDAFELEGEEEEEGREEDVMMDAESASSSGSESEEKMDTGSITSEVPIGDENYDRDVDLQEEAETLKKIRREAEEDKEFPDEVDTPSDISARERYLRYRGLHSFRTSPWDPRENLPLNYARIFQFQNFERTRRQALHRVRNADGAFVGSYVTLELEEVPSYLYRLRGEQPLVVYGLLQHEQKLSVVNMCVQRPPSDEVIKSKEPLLFQCGFRRFRTLPIFSQHTKGNKFKYERFFQSDSTVVATVYAPIIYPPASVLVFKENKDGTSTLLGSGNVLSVDPNRVVVKRVILTGHPYKVNKRSAVIRFMFFNREDIVWFKSIELHTKFGRRGHIREPLGTHGHMKCVFNGQLKSEDTVMLKLYKRVFPKWSYDPKITFKITEEDEK